MEITIEQLKQALVNPGHIVVFFDESELDVYDSPVDLFGGLIMRSDEYPRVEDALAGPSLPT